MHPKNKGMDSDEAPDYVFRNINSNRILIRNDNGIRNLYTPFPKRDRKHPIRHTPINKKTIKVCLLLKLLLIAVLVIVFIVYKNNLTQDLQSNYYIAYERLSQLSYNLCSRRQANFTPILKAIDRNIVGQHHLNGELHNWFQTIGNTSFSCVMFVGRTGVGKSFTANLIAKHYPFPKNVLMVSSKELSNEKKGYAAFKLALFKIVQETITHGICSHYMIVLDNLNPNDIPLVKKISDRLRAVGNAYHLVLQALFVFQGTEHTIEQETILEIIPEVRLIKFTNLSRNDMEYCIRREALAIGIDLSKIDYIVQIVANQINVSRYGCKPVRAKITLHSV